MGRTVALLLLGPLLGSGCSWSTMTRPVEPVPEPDRPVDCTSSKAAPGIDVIFTGAFVVAGLGVATSPDCASPGLEIPCFSTQVKVTSALIAAGLATLSAFSAASGFSNADRCEAIQARNALCIAGNEAACKQLNPAWKSVGIQPPANGPATR